MRRDVTAVLRGVPGDLSGPELREVSTAAVTVSSIVATLVGAMLSILLLTFVLPLPVDPLDEEISVRNLVAAVIFIPVVVRIGLLRGRRYGAEATGWLSEDRPPTAWERRRAVALPARLFVMQLALWSAATVLFTALNVPIDGLWGFEVGITVALSGAATAAVSYLMAIRLGRAVVAVALRDAPPQRYAAVPGVTERALLAWGLGTSVPVVGALLVAAVALGRDDLDRIEVARSTVVLCAIALVIGLLAIVIVARSIAEPLSELREALHRVEEGDLDAAVPVNDASEVGFLQAGFNRMVAGLRERERVRDLFGRHVGRDVARQALEQGITLGGEEREAAALFVDLVGSTTLATHRAPTEVVQILNAFFAVVVEVTGEHGGFVNKFAGDGALCVFGAPLHHDDPCSAALAAARAMQARLVRELPDVQAAVGVSAGTVVAGNVGAAARFEYTVIGDPVNEAARLTELAKDQPSRVCASGAVLERARDARERAAWRLGEAVVLRGRTEPTRLAVPATSQTPSVEDSSDGGTGRA